MEMIKQQLAEKIAKMESELSAISIDRATAKKVSDAQPELKNLVDWLKYYEANEAELEAANLYRQIDMFQETMQIELATVRTRYLLTDAGLQSPAGFDIDSGVWVKNSVWIETDRLPRHSNLQCYDMQEIAAKYA